MTNTEAYDLLKQMWLKKESLYLTESQVNKVGIDEENIKDLMKLGKITKYADHNIAIKL